jgi:parallel beta-helix repeat protein
MERIMGQVKINISIHLIGEDRYNTIIDGAGSYDVIRTEKAGITISGFTIQNSNVPGNLLLFFSENTTVDNNIFTDCMTRAIECHFDNNIITNNYFLSYVLLGAADTILTNNTFVGTGLSVEEDAIRNRIENNIVNGKPLVYLEYTNNTEISEEAGQIILMRCDNITIQQQEISSTYAALQLLFTYNCIISTNTLANNIGGILLYSSKYNSIIENNIINNMGGVFLFHSNFNSIYHNNFINNTQNAYDECNNSWDNGYPSCGNYWDSYTGDDVFWGQNQQMNGSDGVGDNPYNISGGDNKDTYPLMEPYGMTNLSFDFKGGLFKWSGIIKNIGNNTAFNVQWKIVIGGGFVLFGRVSLGTLPKPLLAGEETQMSSNFIFGFGKITITIAVWADNAPYVYKSAAGTLIFFFVII